MTTYNKTYLTKLITNLKPGMVILSPWLQEIGISRNLQKYYRNSVWLEPIGTGAYKRPNDKIDWQGGLYAMQYQKKLNIHAGALTALSLQGLSHFFRFSNEKIFLFSPRKTKLPKWFEDYNWGYSIFHKQTNFLPFDLGITEYEEKNYPIRISSSERAILECLYLSPSIIDLTECYHIMEGLANLRPKLLQKLLQECNSIKVKRLFLYFAEKINHMWMQYIDTSLINIGTGNRRIAGGGVYISKYQITIPNDIALL